jgi:hypothetical protein
MAITPGELVQTVAFALGMPEQSVKNYDRQLMEAGLRTKKGHGRGSALMGPEDAAILLAAIASSDEVRRAPVSVQKLYQLPCLDEPEKQLPILGRVIKAADAEINTFGKAFVEIMRHVVSKRDQNFAFSLDVTIAAGTPCLGLLSVSKAQKTRNIEFWGEGDIVKLGLSGLTLNRSISAEALGDIADVLAGRLDLTTLAEIAKHELVEGAA